MDFISQMIYFARSSNGEIAATVFVNEMTGEMFTLRPGEKDFQRVRSANLGSVNDWLPLITTGAQIGAGLYAQSQANSQQQQQAAAQNEAAFLSQVYQPVFTGLDSLIANPSANSLQQAAQLQSFWDAGVAQFAGAVFTPYTRGWIDNEATPAVRAKVEKVRQAAPAASATSTSASATQATDTDSVISSQIFGVPVWALAVLAGVLVWKARG